MRKILFVDDEPEVLESLQDSLRSHRRRWDMTFACGGQDALSELDNSSFDVIVSDVRMPDTDGVSVLRYAKEHHPKTIRIALTGYANDKNTIELTKLAQRFLTKPCTVEELDEAILRDSGLVEAFDNPIVQELAGSAGRLPADNSVQRTLLEKMNEPEISVEELGDIVERDVALTAKVLQLANSSFFRRQSSIMSSHHAVSYLGLDTLRSLLLADQLFNGDKMAAAPDSFDFKALHNHSVLCSTIAKAISPTEDLGSAAMTAGLLHDIGKIIIVRERPVAAADLIVGQEPSCNWVDSQSERDILGCTHAEIGGYFLNLWGIPTRVVEAVTFHDAPQGIYSKALDAVGIVHISNYLAHWAVEGDQQPMNERKLDRSYLEGLGVLDTLDFWKETTRGIVDERQAA